MKVIAGVPLIKRVAGLGDNRAITLSATNGYGAAPTNVIVVGFFGARQIAARGRGRGQACGKSVKVNSPRSSPTPG